MNFKGFLLSILAFPFLAVAAETQIILASGDTHRPEF
jgi:hypothetical protein